MKKKISIHLAIWCNFIIFSILIFLLLWSFQVVLFQNFMHAKIKNEIIEFASYAQSTFEESPSIEQAKNTLDRISKNSQTRIIIFTVSDSKVIDFIYTSPHKGGEPPLDDDFYYQLMDEVRDQTNIYRVYDREATYLYKSDTNVYYHYVKGYQKSDSTTKVLQEQLLIVSIISLLIGFFLSWFISHKISKPLEKLNSSVLEIAKGNFDVEIPNSKYKELEELGDSINHAKVELSKSDHLQKEIIANVSHDLKTPLTLIKSYAEMIRDISGDDKTKRITHLETIIEESDRLTLLVNDLLNLSKISSDAQVSKREKFSLTTLLTELIIHFEPICLQDNITLKYNIFEDIVINANKQQMEQVIYNFLGNALNYTNTTILINLKYEENTVKLEVIDDGRGIDSSEIDRIWERYYRTKDAHRRQKLGTGLGLSIVQAILDAHGYKYGVESILGKGSNFYFIIDLEKE